MKKISLFLAASFLTVFAFSQADTTKMGNGVDRKFLGYKISNVERNGVSLDSMRIFRIGNDTFRMVYPGRWLVSHAGVYTSSGDIAAKLTLAYSRSYVMGIAFQSDSLATYTLTSTFSMPAGKMMFVDKTCKFTGTGTMAFNNELLDAPVDHQVFSTTLNVTGVKTPFGFFPSAWFGAKGDSSTDNYLAFVKSQAATFTKTQPVYIGNGRFQINTGFTQTVNFVGENGNTKVFFNPSSSAAGVVLWSINDDSLKLENFKLDGSGKTYLGINVLPGATDVLINRMYVTGCEQVGTSTLVVSGIFFTYGVDRLKIYDSYIGGLNAKNSGTVRGIRGDYDGVGPVDVDIWRCQFDSIRNNGAGSLWDCDDIVMQTYKNNLRMKIHENKHFNISKRAVKMMAAGMEVYENTITSLRYKTGNRAFAAISIYCDDAYVHNNTITEGVYENIIDVSGGTQTFNNIRIEDNSLKGSVTSLGNNDGIRVFGKNGLFYRIIRNKIENVRKGIWLNGTTWYAKVADNIVENSTDNAYSTDVSSPLVYPDTWHYGLDMRGNRVKKSTATIGYWLYRVRGGIFADNQGDSVARITYDVALDSVIGVNIHDNVNNTGGKSPNEGKYADLPVLTNNSACVGMLYKVPDSAAFWMRTPLGWQKMAGSGGGGSGLTSAQVKNMIDTTLNNQPNFYIQNGSKYLDTLVFKVSDTVNRVKSLSLTAGSNKLTVTRTARDTALFYVFDVAVANITGIAQSQVTNLAADLAAKQATLVSGVNIKTINGNNLLGSGNLSIAGASGNVSAYYIPTITQGANVTGISTMTLSQYGTPDGNVVTIQLHIVVNTSGTGDAEFTVSLPSGYPIYSGTPFSGLCLTNAAGVKNIGTVFTGQFSGQPKVSFPVVGSQSIVDVWITYRTQL